MEKLSIVESVLDNLPVAVFAKDATNDFRFILWNKKQEEVTTIRAEKALGKNDYHLFSQESADYFRSVDKAVLKRGSLMKVPEEIIETKNGREVHLRTVKIPVKDEETGRLLVVGISEDITEQVKSREQLERLNRHLVETNQELQQTQMQLIQAEKLDSLGRLAAGVAHEVRNPLGAVQMGISYLMQRQSSLQDTGIGFACTEMEKAIRRADGIIQGMLDYAREDIMNLQRYCPNRLVEESVKFVQYDLNRRNVEIRFELDPEIPSVQIDTQRMNQVIINLISNSIQAMKTGGLVTVSTSSGKMGELERDEGLRDHLRLRSDETVVLISIRDTGPGIPPEKIHRIFEPFFTTKPTGEGTGLGLSVVDRIIQLHRGHITVENVSEPTGLRTTIALKSV